MCQHPFGQCRALLNSRIDCFAVINSVAGGEAFLLIKIRYFGEIHPQVPFPDHAGAVSLFFQHAGNGSAPGFQNGAEYPPITSDFTTERRLYLPVRKPYREGVHTAAVAWASVNRIPLRHIMSRFGVVKGHFSLKADMSPYPILSARM